MAEGPNQPEYIPSSEERRQNRARAKSGTPTSGGGPSSRWNWWSRRSTKAKAAMVAVGVIISLAAIGAATGGGGGKQAVVTVTHTQTTTPEPPVQTPAQRRAAAKAVARARTIARTRARAAVRAERLAAAQHAAYVAAANRWHLGYVQQDGNVYWQWRNGSSCQEFAQSGCWHVAVITRFGCSSYVGVNANEYQGSSIIGQLLDNQGYGIPPKTVRIFELDADTSSVTANDVSIDCT
jgi:hypothetical protein